MRFLYFGQLSFLLLAGAQGLKLVGLLEFFLFDLGLLNFVFVGFPTVSIFELLFPELVDFVGLGGGR